MTERAFLDFYNEINIIPVRQEGAGSINHFEQRTALYRMLGVTPLMVKNSEVLEIGPGYGDNALHISSWQPASMTFIDAANASVDAVQKRINQGHFGNNATIHNADVSQKKLMPDFDIVLCEGLIPGQSKPKAFLNNVLTAVKPGGVCVFTTLNSVSYLAEICRRILLPLIEQKEDSQQQLINKLVTFFQPSFDRLEGMTRSPQDWVLDNIIHDSTKNGMFSIKDALQSLPNDFSVLGSSPSFLQDWRWYKNSRGNNTKTILQSYQAWSSYLIDYRIQPTRPLLPEESKQLEVLCELAMKTHDLYRKHKKQADLSIFLNILSDVCELIKEDLPDTVAAIKEFQDAIPMLLERDFSVNLNLFHTWFGRGQQYLSVVKEL